jgi:hypothetical protein
VRFQQKEGLLMSSLGGLLFLLILSAVSWVLALNKSARAIATRKRWRISKFNKEHEEIEQSLFWAGALVAAITFSFLFIILLVTVIVESLK